LANLLSHKSMNTIFFVALTDLLQSMTMNDIAGCLVARTKTQQEFTNWERTLISPSGSPDFRSATGKKFSEATKWFTRPFRQHKFILKIKLEQNKLLSLYETGLEAKLFRLFLFCSLISSYFCLISLSIKKYSLYCDLQSAELMIESIYNFFFGRILISQIVAIFINLSLRPASDSA
jgi:hypothetical protein